MGQARVGAAQLLGDVRVAHREATHMQFVDDGVRPLNPRAGVVPPVEGVVPDDDRLRHERRVVRAALEQSRVEDHVPRHGTRVWIEQEFGVVEAPSLAGIPWPVYPQSVALARPHAEESAVPDVEGSIHQRDPGFVVRLIEQTDLD
jgi:hypothetical protein